MMEGFIYKFTVIVLKKQCLKLLDDTTAHLIKFEFCLKIEVITRYVFCY